MKRELLMSGLVAALMAAPIGLVSAADPVSAMGDKEFGLGASEKSRKDPSIERANLSADELWDQTVYDLENRKVGTVMAVTENRKAIVEIEGILGFGDKHVTVPVQRFQMKSDGRLVVTLTEDELERMPEIREEDISAIRRRS